MNWKYASCRFLLAATILAALVLVPMACDGDDCEGACECTGTECLCPASGDCLVNCVGDCDLQCAGSGDCDFACGDTCAVRCTGSGQCLSTIGDDSTVSCTGSGDCEIDCEGDCEVSCPGSGACVVYCEEGFACDLACEAGAQSCPEGLLVCGIGCPS